MTKRLKKLWKFIDDNLEADYGYLPKSHMDDKDNSRVNEYIQEIKDDFVEMREKGQICEDAIEESINILKGLDKI